MKFFLRTARLLPLLPLLTMAQQPAPLDKRGIRVETEERVKLEPPKSGVVVPRGLALIIGVAKYKNLEPGDNLNYTEKDAELIYNVLISPEGGNFAPQHVRKLVGSQATLAAVRKAIEEWLPAEAQAQDRVLIYFAGHGVAAAEDGKGYLAPYDVDLKRLRETAYPMDRLAEVFRSKINAKWKVLLTDACHSGLVSRDLDAVSESVANMGQILTFSASRSNESAYEDVNVGHGLFTYYVEKALRGEADRDGDGRVTADEFVDYVRAHVVEHALKSEGKVHQTPRENQDSSPDLVLAFNPNRVPKESVATEGTLVVQSNMDEVEFFLDDQSKGTVGRNSPLQLPAIKAGKHVAKAVHLGYEPDGPRDVWVYPGRTNTIEVRIQYARKRSKSALNLFKQGFDNYQKAKSEAQCREAAGYFKKALAADPAYSEAAMYLGRSYRMLGEDDAAVKYQRLAIELDPDYVEARISYGILLTDTGNTDEAIRQLSQAAQREPKNDLIYSHMAYAYRLADNFEESARQARQALALNSGNAAAHLWLGDCLRHGKKFAEAEREYSEYVRLTNFDANLYYKALMYAVLPTFTTRAGSQQVAYRDQRNQGFLGLCICEEKLGNFNLAVQYCKRALSYDPQDAYSFFHLGLVNVNKYNVSSRRDALLTAQGDFHKVIEINPDLEEARQSRQYLEQIESTLKRLPSRN